MRCPLRGGACRYHGGGIFFSMSESVKGLSLVKGAYLEKVTFGVALGQNELYT